MASSNLLIILTFFPQDLQDFHWKYIRNSFHFLEYHKHNFTKWFDTKENKLPFFPTSISFLNLSICSKIHHYIF